jgi:hypothetical protein
MMYSVIEFVGSQEEYTEDQTWRGDRLRHSVPCCDRLIYFVLYK